MIVDYSTTSRNHCEWIKQNIKKTKRLFLRFRGTPHTHFPLSPARLHPQRQYRGTAASPIQLGPSPCLPINADLHSYLNCHLYFSKSKKHASEWFLSEIENELEYWKTRRSTRAWWLDLTHDQGVVIYDSLLTMHEITARAPYPRGPYKPIFTRKIWYTSGKLKILA